MTTKNCANGPKLVLKDLCEMTGYQCKLFDVCVVSKEEEKHVLT